MDYLFDGPPEAKRVFVFAHGAGGAMDTPFMTKFARGLGENGIRVIRFEFPYMAARRTTGKRGAPDRQPVLLEHFRKVVADAGGRPFIGGKSMGGRMASMVADELNVAGLICLGYPFHPPGKPEQLRTAHLAALRTPSLIVQGERDPLGTRPEVEGYSLSPAIRLEWLKDGDHSFKPRVQSGTSEVTNLAEGIKVVTAFILK
ncbi:MAG TPA: alpha/beta fold hydrolase [Thermoanaerobaculia bacterium]